MAALVWSAVGERKYEHGLDRGVLYRSGLAAGVPWNGLIQVSERSSGGGLTPYYYDGFMYHVAEGSRDYAASIQAFSYPDAFAACLGEVGDSNGLYFDLQPKLSFGLSYRTRIGNDVSADLGYKIHIVYNAKAADGGKAFQTLTNSPSPINFSWDILARPVLVTNRKPTAHLIIDSTKVFPAHLVEIENILYGTVSTNPRIPTPAELLAIVTS